MARPRKTKPVEKEVTPLPRRGVGAPLRFTPDVKARFLDILAEIGNVGRAAEAVGVKRHTVSRHRKSDDIFEGQCLEYYKEGKENVADMLEEEARRRAYDGFEEPVFYKGKEVGRIRKFSDTLLIFLLKAARPDIYREKTDVNYQGSITIEVKKFGEESVNTKQLVAKARSVTPLALLGEGGKTGSGSGTPKVG